MDSATPNSTEARKDVERLLDTVCNGNIIPVQEIPFSKRTREDYHRAKARLDRMIAKEPHRSSTEYTYENLSRLHQKLPLVNYERNLEFMIRIMAEHKEDGIIRFDVLLDNQKDGTRILPIGEFNSTKDYNPELKNAFIYICKGNKLHQIDAKYPIERLRRIAIFITELERDKKTRVTMGGFEQFEVLQTMDGFPLRLGLENGVYDTAKSSLVVLGKDTVQLRHQEIRDMLFRNPHRYLQEIGIDTSCI